MQNLLKHIDAILDLEWEMFQAVQNIGGPASCQQDQQQFFIMRCAQFSVWSSPAAASYLEDLRQAKADGGNPLTLKYAYMMQSTNPQEFQRIAERLPPISPEKQELVERLVSQTLLWCESFERQYPQIAAHGRPVRSQADKPNVTSVETYSRGEFASYSLQTLRLLSEHYSQMAAAGRNLHTEVVSCEMALLHLGTLEEVERKLAQP